MFITFEGLEGAGKSTQAELLAGRLREEGYKIVATREPGGTRIGEQIRAITHNRENIDLTAEAEAYLMSAARAQHVSEIILPALNDKKIVVCDRFIDSSLAYQGYGRQLGFETIIKLNELALKLNKETKLAIKSTHMRKSYSRLLFPDVTFLLDVDLDIGIERRNGTGKVDRLDLQQKEFYERVREGYDKIAEKFKERVIRINASNTIEDVKEEVWEYMQKKISN